MRRLKHWIAVVFVFLGFTIHAQVITTVAGTGVFGHTGDGGKAATATLAAPVAVVADQADGCLAVDLADLCEHTRGLTLIGLAEAGT